MRIIMVEHIHRLWQAPIPPASQISFRLNKIDNACATNWSEFNSCDMIIGRNSLGRNLVAITTSLVP